MKSKYRVEKDQITAFSCDRLLDCNKMHHLPKIIILVIVFGESEENVHECNCQYTLTEQADIVTEHGLDFIR